MSKLGLFFMCDKNSGFWNEICDIFFQYIEKIGIGLKYITYFTPESRVFVASNKLYKGYIFTEKIESVQK